MSEFLPPNSALGVQVPLGQPSAYVDRYAPELLAPIARSLQRRTLWPGDPLRLPFLGADVWTAYELSWLNPRGKPQIAMVRLLVPCETPNLIESKSLKLYLNSFNQTVFGDVAEVQQALRRDLTRALWGDQPVGSGLGLQWVAAEQFDQEPIHELDGLNLDRLDIECQHYQPHPVLLTAAFEEQPVSEVLCSRLLKSSCLVTGQPDWGSIQIGYSGPQIDQAGLLAYLISFRQHQEFHEHCVERIFTDLWRHCRPTQLWVWARYTRRGGLDISPFRSSHPRALPALHRTARQ